MIRKLANERSQNHYGRTYQKHFLKHTKVIPYALWLKYLSKNSKIYFCWSQFFQSLPFWLKLACADLKISPAIRSAIKLTTFRTPDLQLMATQNFKGRTKTHDMIGPQRGLNLKDIFHMIKRWYLMNCKGPICMRNHTLIWGLRRKRRVTPDHFSFGSSILCLHLKSLKNISSLLN